MDLVSVIIPAYNAEKWIEGGLRSAIAQTYPSIEIIVVDDGSKDDTVTLAKQTLSNEFKGKWQVIELGGNRGVSVARNTAIAAASGNWVQTLDSDDLIAPQKIELQMPLASTSPSDVAGVYSSWRKIFNDEGHIEWAGPVYVPNLDGRAPIMNLVFDYMGHINAFLLRRETLKKVGGFDETLRHWEIYELMVRIAVQGGRYVHAPSSEPLFFWRIHRHKPHIGGADARYLQSDISLGWIDQALKASGGRSVSQLGLSREEEKALLHTCTSYGQQLRLYDREAFQNYLAKALPFSNGRFPTHPWYLAALSTIMGYENAELVAGATRALKKQLRTSFARATRS